MRLRDIQNILEVTISDIKISISGIGGDPNNMRIGDLVDFRRAIDTLRKTNIFEKNLSQISQFQSVLESAEDLLVFPKIDSQKLLGHVNALKQKAIGINEALSELLPIQSDKTLSIKLPPIKDFSQLSKISERLDKLFDQLFSPISLKGKIEVQNFDTGSEWVEVVFESTKALSILASVAFAAIHIKRERLKNDNLREDIRRKNLSNNLYETLSKELDSELKSNLSQNAIEIAKEACDNPPDHEYTERVKYCINEMKDLVDSGMRLFLTKDAEPGIQSRFPDFSKPLIEQMIPEIKKIEKGPPEEDAQN